MSKRPGWKCFHCGDVFTRPEDAAEHFGGTELESAACQIKGHEHNLLHLIRRQERELASYRDDRDDVMRAMMSLQAEHAEALRRAEEQGFDRGVRDMRGIAERQFGAEVLV